MKLIKAILAGPGPQTPAQALVLWLKGVAMGTADIIPGVSGGTVAFITGIYQDLLAAIRSFDLAFLRLLLRGRLTEALEHAHLKFLLPLLFGIGLALVSTANVMHYLLEYHPVPIWSLFFGLIAASIIVVVRRVGRIDAKALAAMALGTAVGFLIVGLIPVQTPETLWFVFLCGVVSICAMILPGISGAFILLILGKYAYITGAIKDPLVLGNILIMVCFFAGAALGLAGFSRVLTWLFEHYHDLTISLLAGFMLGAMRKIWPWKEALESVEIRGKVHVLVEQNVLPPALDDGFWLAVGLAAVGFVLVMALEAVSRRLEAS